LVLRWSATAEIPMISEAARAVTTTINVDNLGPTIGW
jgi:hypothetical protein